MALMMFYRFSAVSWDDAQGRDKFQDLVFESNLVAVLHLKGENKSALSECINYHVSIWVHLVCFSMETRLGSNSFNM